MGAIVATGCRVVDGTVKVVIAAVGWRVGLARKSAPSSLVGHLPAASCRSLPGFDFRFRQNGNRLMEVAAAPGSLGCQNSFPGLGQAGPVFLEKHQPGQTDEWRTLVGIHFRRALVSSHPHFGKMVIKFTANTIWSGDGSQSAVGISEVLPTSPLFRLSLNS